MKNRIDIKVLSKEGERAKIQVILRDEFGGELVTKGYTVAEEKYFPIFWAGMESLANIVNHEFPLDKVKEELVC